MSKIKLEITAELINAVDKDGKQFEYLSCYYENEYVTVKLAPVDRTGKDVIKRMVARANN